jgi:hypothetical protein
MDSDQGDKQPSPSQRLPVNPRRHKVAPDQRKRVATAYVMNLSLRKPTILCAYNGCPDDSHRSQAGESLRERCANAAQMQQLQPSPYQVLRGVTLQPLCCFLARMYLPRAVGKGVHCAV